MWFWTRTRVFCPLICLQPNPQKPSPIAPIFALLLVFTSHRYCKSRAHYGSLSGCLLAIYLLVYHLYLSTAWSSVYLADSTPVCLRSWSFFKTVKEVVIETRRKKARCIWYIRSSDNYENFLSAKNLAATGPLHQTKRKLSDGLPIWKSEKSEGKSRYTTPRFIQ